MHGVITIVFSNNTIVLELTKVFFQSLSGFDDRDVKPQVWSLVSDKVIALLYSRSSLSPWALGRVRDC